MRFDAARLRGSTPDEVLEQVTKAAHDDGLSLYPHQEEALVAILAGEHAIVTTPTGSGKSLIALAAHAACLAAGGRTYYSAPIKALVSEKFFALCHTFGAENVGMVTGDAQVNPEAGLICCTAEIVANLALREGAEAAIDQLVMDEFHFIADPDRGWAWQVALTELPQAQHVIMSATLGDVGQLADDLTERSGRDVAIIAGATRPVPLSYRWSMDPIDETIAGLLREDQAPVYVVHPTQAAAVERAQSLTLELPASRKKAISEAIAGFRFAPGFGKLLATMVRSGVGVHHAGLLPKYRRLVETLAQQGLLPVISGTDTLGVGVNVPIRTVLFSQLSKFDGRRMRVLRSREFHQIAGRAGRAGFDTQGFVVAQAPEHVIENHRLVAKAGDDPKKLKKLVRKKPPEGFVSWTEQSFEKLIGSTPEALHGRLSVTPALLLNLLQRDTDTAAAFASLVQAATADDAVRRTLYRRAVAIGRSLLASGTVVRLAEPTAGGRRFALADDLQTDFALNQPLSAFAAEVLEVLDPDSPTYAHDVVSVIEATLDDPMQVLLQQQFKARGEAVAELKADGVEYEERMRLLEQITWPKPLDELLQHTFSLFAPRHPWVNAGALSPKSVVRDMAERAMTFGEFVAYYQLQRSEGTVLRYLSDVFRALRQSVPQRYQSPEVDDLIDWLGLVIRHTDSSLLDEWDALTHPETPTAAPTPQAARFTSNQRAMRVMVRNAMFYRVQLAARDDVTALGSLEQGNEGFSGDDWDDALADYFDEHDELSDGPQARSPQLLMIDSATRTWHVRQIIDDPAGNHDWAITADVDLDASDEAERLVIATSGFARQD
ncbi:MAG: DEAD/DEAH box helicase [Arachnia sp.]